MNNKILSFGESVYRKAFYRNILNNVKNRYSISKIKDFIVATRNILVNYTPIVGHLPVSLQLFLKDKVKILFSDIDVRTSTLSSAFVSLIFACLIGIFLDGFDIGYSEEISDGWWKSGVYEYKSYIGEYLPFLGLKYGFNYLYTKIFFSYIILSSIFRITIHFTRRYIGSPILELPVYLMNRFSERSRYKKEAEYRIKENQDLLTTVDSFTEKNRRKEEEYLCKKTLSEFLKEVL